MSIDARNKDWEMQSKALNRKGGGGTEPIEGAKKEEMENIVVVDKTSSPLDDNERLARAMRRVCFIYVENWLFFMYCILLF